MHNRSLVLIFLVSLSGCARLPAPPQLLDSLAVQLHTMRSLPIGAPTHALCPSDTKPLINLSQGQVQAALGNPDYIDESENSWSYFFTSPRPQNQLGGGFPELTFTFGLARHVKGVTCNYSK